MRDCRINKLKAVPLLLISKDYRSIRESNHYIQDYTYISTAWKQDLSCSLRDFSCLELLHLNSSVLFKKTFSDDVGVDSSSETKRRFLILLNYIVCYHHLRLLQKEMRNDNTHYWLIYITWRPMCNHFVSPSFRL